MHNKVYVIGLDGASEEMMDFWIKKGMMPNLKKLTSQSSWGYTNSVIPPMTAPAWNTFLTGKNPGKHGIFDFVIEKKNTSGYRIVNSYDRKEHAIWYWVENSGGRSVVLNVPTTYPPEKTNGVIVSGFLTPPEADDYISPLNMREEIERKFGAYPLYFSTNTLFRNSSLKGAKTFIKECISHLRYKFDVSQYLIKKIRPNFFFLHIFSNDQISHVYWHIIDSAHPSYSGRLSSCYISLLASFYKTLDEKIGEFLSQLDGNTTFILLSDHGFGRWEKIIFLNTWLLKEGYLKIKKHPLSRGKYILFKLGLTQEAMYRYILKILLKLGWFKKDIPYRRRIKTFYTTRSIFLTRKDIDLARSIAVCGMNFGQINIRTKSKFKDAPLSQSQYHKVREEIVEKLRKIKDPFTEQVIPSEIYRKEEIYRGPYQDGAPDIVYLPLKAGYVGTTIFGFDSRCTVTPSLTYTGVHRQRGLYYFWGRKINSSRKKIIINLEDFMPTILYLLGAQIPEDCDGIIRKELIARDYLRENRERYCAPHKKRGFFPEKSFRQDYSEVEERMRSLGYL